jgi:hypothetical protein
MIFHAFSIHIPHIFHTYSMIFHTFSIHIPYIFHAYSMIFHAFPIHIPCIFFIFRGMCTELVRNTHSIFVPSSGCPLEAHRRSLGLALGVSSGTWICQFLMLFWAPLRMPIGGSSSALREVVFGEPYCGIKTGRNNHPLFLTNVRLACQE